MDIKPANILIDTNAKQLWLIDFGSAVSMDRLRSNKDGDWGGTWMYMAPELLEGKKSYTHKVDIWSVGVVLVEWVSYIISSPLTITHYRSTIYYPLPFLCSLDFPSAPI